MPWDRWKHNPGVGGMIELAREARGITIDALVARIADTHLYRVRQMLNNPASIDDRRLARQLTDAAIAERLAAFTADELARLEQTPTEPDRLTLAALSAALDVPIAFFRQPNPPRPEIIAHLKFADDIERDRDYHLCVVCGFLADFLCDYPTGDGDKTCDANLCERHALSPGPGFPGTHLCPAHAHFAREMVAMQGGPR